jgi:hypothetical protein
VRRVLVAEGKAAQATPQIRNAPSDFLLGAQTPGKTFREVSRPSKEQPEQPGSSFFGARTYQINRTTVLEHLRRQGVQRRRPRRLQKVDIDNATRLYTRGASIASVAHELRVGPTTVRRLLKQTDVTTAR